MPCENPAIDEKLSLSLMNDPKPLPHNLECLLSARSGTTLSLQTTRYRISLPQFCETYCANSELKNGSTLSFHP